MDSLLEVDETSPFCVFCENQDGTLHVLKGLWLTTQAFLYSMSIKIHPIHPFIFLLLFQHKLSYKNISWLLILFPSFCIFSLGIKILLASEEKTYVGTFTWLFVGKWIQFEWQFWYVCARCMSVCTSVYITMLLSDSMSFCVFPELDSAES